MNGAVACRWKTVRDSAWLPLGALLMALSTVFLFVGERGHFYSSYGTVSGAYQNHDTAKNMALAANLSPERRILFHYKWRNANGEVRYRLYNRFPIGTYVLVKFATAPFHGDLFARVVAARTLMLAFFCAAAVLAYLALAGMVGRAAALIATLLGFSSYHLLDYNDVVSNEMSVGLFGMMLVLHGMVRFREHGRFWQLAAKVGVALLLDWHVYGLLLPFLALGIAREAWTGWASAGTPLARVRGAAGQALRSRSALFGVIALLFGVGVLGYNLMQEYAAFEGQRAVADLPSAKSVAKRTWAPPSDNPEYAWPTFLEWQLHRAGTMVLPFGLATGLDFDESQWRASGVPSLFALGLVCTVACLAGLALLSRRHRATLAALALSGFCWAFLARGNTAYASHQHEAMFYLGVPLVLFAALFSLAQRRWPRWAGFAAAAAAVLIFVWSSVAMGLTQRDLGKERAGRALMAEFDAVTGAIHGKTVLIPAHRLGWRRFLPHPTTLPSTINVLMAGAFVQDRGTARLRAMPRAAPALDFVLAFERFELPSLLTPSHRTVFLYEAGSDAGGVLQAMLAARRADWRRLNTANLVAQSAFDIRFVPGGRGYGGQLAFLRTPCVEGDTHGRFHVRARPVYAADLAPWRARLGFHHRQFYFPAYGDVFDDKCLLRVPLPAWPIANVRVGQYKASPSHPSHPEPRGLEWHASFRLDWDRLRKVRDAALARAPTVRGMFDVHMRNGELIYLRQLCAAQDVRPRFFLHVFPAVGDAEPEAAGRFDNLDFDFAEHGALIDGGCVVLLTLPHGPGWVRTGQFDPDRGVIWQAEFAPP